MGGGGEGVGGSGCITCPHHTLYKRKIRRFCGAISLLFFNKSRSNLASLPILKCSSKVLNLVSIIINEPSQFQMHTITDKYALEHRSLILKSKIHITFTVKPVLSGHPLLSGQ